MVAGSYDNDDLFNRLVSKQAGREINQASSEKATDATRASANALFTLMKSKGKDFEESDLLIYKRLGIEISSELAMLAGLFQGFALPLLETSEVKTEPLGELGVCLYTDAQLFAFRDAVDGVVYIPPQGNEWWNRTTNCTRFQLILQSFMHWAFRWTAIEYDWAEDVGDGQPLIVKWGGIWVGDPAKSVIEHWSRLGVQNSTLNNNDMEKMEKVEFEIQMRRAFGK